MVKKAWRPADSESFACQFQLEICQKTRNFDHAHIDSDGILAATGWTWQPLAGVQGGL
jgi:hypothetical protein